MATTSVTESTCEPDFAELFLAMRKIRAITPPLELSDSFLEERATRNDLCGLLEAITEIASATFRAPKE